MIPDIGNINVNVNGIPVVGIGNINDVNDVNVNDVQNVNVQSIGVSGPKTIKVADNRIWVINPPNVQQMEPPVVVDVGVPIVNIAGCVEVHKENARNRNRNKQLVDNDPKGNTVLCDAGAPSFRALDYQSNRLKWETFYGDPPEVNSGVDVGDPPPTPTPNTPDPPKTPSDTAEDPPCPGPMAPRIGDVAQNQKEKVSGFELQRDPRNPDGAKICVTLYEDIGVVEAYLPTPQVATTTAVIATVATGSALLAKPLADLLLKVVKPVVKKAITFVKTKVLKQKEPTLSTRERMLKQRELTEAVRAERKLKGK